MAKRFPRNPYMKIYRGGNSKTSFNRPEGAGNFDNMDDRNFVQSCNAKVHAGYGIVPIGCILPFHKSFTNTPTLPDGWVECNGQTLSDAESIYNGRTIPNLNVTFSHLLGYTTSGISGGALTHSHTGTTHTSGDCSEIDTVEGETSLSNCNHTHEFTTSAASNLGPYMTIIWIMRIK